MSKKTKYLKEEDLTKFDNFIQDSLNKYFYVDTWDKLISNTGKDSYDIISFNSTIPDLVIYNKTFNKSKCFLHTNKNTKFIKFPRVQFILRPKKVKNYNPSNTYGVEEKKEPKVFEEPKNLEPFEFKSIPKEIEDKYTNDNKNTAENNQLFDELKDFMKSDKDKDSENKVKIIKENENLDNQINNQVNQSNQNNVENKKQQEGEEDKPKDNNKKHNNKNRKYSNNRNYPKNKFGDPFNINSMNNMNNFNNVNNINNNNVNINPNVNMNNIGYSKNYLDIQKMRMMQYIQFQKHINETLGMGMYNLNNNQNNKFNQIPNNVNKNIPKNDNINSNNINNNQINAKNINSNNNIINTDNQSNNNNTIQYFQNDNKGGRDDIEKIMSGLDYFFNKNENRRGWKVVDKNNIIVNKFNNEQLFFFLNTINNREGDKNFAISDLDDDVLFNPLEIYEHLKKKYEK